MDSRRYLPALLLLFIGSGCAALKTVFGGKATVNMFEMTKLVNKHLK